MHHNHLEAIATVQKIAAILRHDDYEAADVSVHPPFTDLRSIQTLLHADRIPIVLGAQHCHWEERGAFTGEVSPAFLAKLAVRYVIVGHSERRQLFGQTDEVVAGTLSAVLAHAMTPILCVGETLAEREAGQTRARVEGQVRAALRGVPAEKVSEMVIAYEPVWAIGTGRNATPTDAQAECKAVRELIRQSHGAAAADGVRIQYGGSVKAANAAELMAEPDVDGALVGGASLDPEEFVRIVRFRLAG